MAQATDNTSKNVEATDKKRGNAKHDATNLKTVRALASGDTYTIYLKDMLGDLLEPFRKVFENHPILLGKVIMGLLFGYDRKVANFTAESKELGSAKVIELRLGEWKRLCNPTEKWIAEDKESKGAVAKAEKEALTNKVNDLEAKNVRITELAIAIATATDEAEKASLMAELQALTSPPEAKEPEATTEEAKTE